MQIFINEVSLEGQYLSNADFEQSIKQFTSILSTINNMINNHSIYREDIKIFLNYQAIKEDNFNKSLNNLKDKSQKDAFTNILLNKINPIEWRQNRIHSTSDNFDCLMIDKNYKDVKDTSLAEVAERKLQNNTTIYLVINFINSSFNNPHIEIKDCCLISVIKNNDEKNLIELDGIDNKNGLENWINNKLPLNYVKYNNQAKEPPQDEQTILSDTKRFRKTPRTFQGRTIYCEIETENYWYVDNLHYGEAAHIEVFDKTGYHIGEANLEGIINELKRDKNKRIDL